MGEVRANGLSNFVGMAERKYLFIVKHNLVSATILYYTSKTFLFQVNHDCINKGSIERLEIRLQNLSL